MIPSTECVVTVECRTCGQRFDGLAALLASIQHAADHGHVDTATSEIRTTWDGAR